MAKNIKNLNRKTAELFVALLLYTAVYLFFIGPAIGAVTGFDTPATSFVGASPTITLSVRTLLFILTGVVALYGYVQLRPRTVGAEPNEYWNQ